MEEWKNPFTGSSLGNIHFLIKEITSPKSPFHLFYSNLILAQQISEARNIRPPTCYQCFNYAMP